MSFYRTLRKDPAASIAEKTKRVSTHLDGLIPAWDARFGTQRPGWEETLEWIETVEFGIPPSPVSVYNSMKRKWRFTRALPHLVAGRRMLDVGCGLGTDGIILHLASGVEIMGVELDPLSLAICGIRLEWYKRRLGLPDTALAAPRHMNATNLAFEAETFDFVWSNESIEHIDPPDALFAEVYRVLRPGGRFFVINQNGLSVYEQLKAIRTRGFRIYYKDRDPLSGAEIRVAEERLLTPTGCRRRLRHTGFVDSQYELNAALPSILSRSVSPRTLSRIDRWLCSMPVLRSQASDFVLIARKG